MGQAGIEIEEDTELGEEGACTNVPAQVDIGANANVSVGVGANADTDADGGVSVDANAYTDENVSESSGQQKTEQTCAPIKDVLIIGCGNLLRGDDGVGPILVRRLFELGLPPGVRLADGGTAGMDVAFAMAGADEVVIVDACKSGGEVGAVFELPGEEVETPPLQGINLHAFRFDHAIAFGHWLLKERYPAKVTVFLVEAGHFNAGEPLSAPVEAAMEHICQLLLERFAPQERGLSESSLSR